MNINRLRPTGVKPDDLDLWLSGVINDAIRDAREAGLDQRSVAYLLRTFARGACKQALVPLVEEDEADVLRDGLKFVAQTVHQAYHEGPIEECPKNTCDHAMKLLGKK